MQVAGHSYRGFPMNKLQGSSSCPSSVSERCRGSLGIPHMESTKALHSGALPRGFNKGNAMPHGLGTAFRAFPKFSAAGSPALPTSQLLTSPEDTWAMHCRLRGLMPISPDCSGPLEAAGLLWRRRPYALDKKTGQHPCLGLLEPAVPRPENAQFFRCMSSRQENMYYSQAIILGGRYWVVCLLVFAFYLSIVDLQYYVSFRFTTNDSAFL